MPTRYTTLPDEELLRPTVLCLLIPVPVPVPAHGCAYLKAVVLAAPGSSPTSLGLASLQVVTLSVVLVTHTLLLRGSELPCGAWGPLLRPRALMTGLPGSLATLGASRLRYRMRRRVVDGLQLLPRATPWPVGVLPAQRGLSAVCRRPLRVTAAADCGTVLLGWRDAVRTGADSVAVLSLGTGERTM